MEQGMATDGGDELKAWLGGEVSKLESGMRALESSVRAVESGMRTLESGVRTLESGMRTLESGVRAEIQKVDAKGDATRGSLERKIEASAAEGRRHTEVLFEALSGDIKLVAEGHGALADGQRAMEARLTRRINEVETDLGAAIRAVTGNGGRRETRER